MNGRRPAVVGLLLAGMVALGWLAFAGRRDPAQTAVDATPPPTPTRAAAATAPDSGTANTAAGNDAQVAPAAALPAMHRAALTAHSPVAVASGADFVVQLELRAGAPVTGWLDLAYDAGMLTLADASTDYAITEPGVVRLRVASIDAQPTTVSVAFSSSPGATAAAVLHVRGGELLTEANRRVALDLPAPAQVQLQPPAAAPGGAN